MGPVGCCGGGPKLVVGCCGVSDNYSSSLLGRWVLLFSLERAWSIFLLAASMCSYAVLRSSPIRDATSARPSSYSNFREKASCCFSVSLCMYCERSTLRTIPSAPFDQCSGLFVCPPCPPAISAGTAPAAAISSLRTVSIAAPNPHKKTFRAPLSSKRVWLGPSLSADSLFGTCCSFKNPIPKSAMETPNSQAGARQSVDGGKGARDVGMGVDTVPPGTYANDAIRRSLRFSPSQAKTYQSCIHSNAP